MDCENYPKDACIYGEEFCWFIHSNTVSNESSGKEYNCNICKNSFVDMNSLRYLEKKEHHKVPVDRFSM